MFFDSHCHLTSDALASRLADVLDRARQEKVTRILNIGDTIESTQGAISQLSVAEQYDIEMFVSAGVHPQNALQFDIEQTPLAIRALAEHSNVVAIGEVGLDFVYDDNHEKFPGASRELQEAVLRMQLDLARKLDLPVVIHNREADQALLRVIREYSGLRGVFHCFGSSVEVARQVLDLGFYLGFTGIITFKNGEEVREVARLCPLDRMLIETDAPYLAPVPHRGKSNEPSFVPFVAQTLAELHERSTTELAEITTRNAGEMFQLDIK